MQAIITLPTMSTKSVDRNPHMDDRSMDHWRCTLRYQGRRMTLTFSMGRGHNGKIPETKEVLECLFSDAGCVGDSFNNFNDFCDNMGYDTDSRKALSTFKAIERQAIALRKLLGNDYDAISEAVQS